VSDLLSLIELAGAIDNFGDKLTGKGLVVTML
jgi:hypothetical protein